MVASPTVVERGVWRSVASVSTLGLHFVSIKGSLTFSTLINLNKYCQIFIIFDNTIPK